ncbi:MAG: CRTAC1 family protein [Bryobacterales bacterium]|nr:CRTAC1 family protein [Bryobacterales bacterium]
MRRYPAALCLLAVAAATAPDVVFRDIAARAGLTATIHSGGVKKNYVLEVNGSGVCWLDYDGDGWQDLYLVNGATLAHLQGKAPAPSRNYLYRNNGNGTFTDVTLRAGVPGRGWGFGCVAADYDNDGRLDLFLSNFGPNILYRNRGDGTFADVSKPAGIEGGAIWHAGAAFADTDRDGDLDLFVPGYLDFNLRQPELKTCEYRGVKVNACGPLGYAGAPDAFYRNNGDGTFTDATEAAGLADRKLYFGFQAVFEDFNNDGAPDLFVGNDSNPNYLYRNKGGGTFEEVGASAGAAFSADGKEMSSMGVAVADYDRDGWMDLFVTTFADDNYILFHNDGDGLFTDVSYPSGAGEPTVPYLGWAAFFFDYDNDGWPDLLCANGHVYPEVDGKINETYRQPLQLLGNLGGGKFAERKQPLAALPHQPSRGGAYADFDNDGDLDFAISTMDGKPLLLENRGAHQQAWLRVRLEGARSNRMGVGARVRVTPAGGDAQLQTMRAGEGYLSSNDPRLHFGLGAAATTADVEINWPSGLTQTIKSIPVRRELIIREADAQKN